MGFSRFWFLCNNAHYGILVKLCIFIHFMDIPKFLLIERYVLLWTNPEKKGTHVVLSYRSFYLRRIVFIIISDEGKWWLACFRCGTHITSISDLFRENSINGKLSPIVWYNYWYVCLWSFAKIHLPNTISFLGQRTDSPDSRISTWIPMIFGCQSLNIHTSVDIHIDIQARISMQGHITMDIRKQ